MGHGRLSPCPTFGGAGLVRLPTYALEVRMRFLFAICTATAILTGCGVNSQDSPASPELSAEPTGSAFDGLFIRISADRVREIQTDSSTSAFQREALQDGVLTFAEYESAVLQMASCVEDSGGEVKLDLNVRGGYKHIISYPIDRTDVAAAVQKCVTDSLSVIEQLWAEVTAVPELDLQTAMVEMRTCLIDRGFPDPPVTSEPSDFRLYMRTLNSRGEFSEERMTEYQECAQRVEDKWGLSYFAPVSID